MTSPQADLRDSLLDSVEVDHAFCEDCYPDYDPPAMLCGVAREDAGPLCQDNCGHPVCQLCVELLRSHKCR